MFAGCRCPRCSESVLVVREIEGRKLLACRTCAGAFVGAELGLRLLAILKPDVPPPRVGVPSPACPVCRQGMRRVVAAGFDVETCKAHGVWFDAGDLPPLVRAVSEALGKTVPAALETLQQQRPPDPTAPATAAPPTPSPITPGQPLPQHVPQRTMADDVTDALSVPLDTAAEIALFPFRATLSTLDIVCELIDVLD